MITEKGICICYKHRVACKWLSIEELKEVET